MKSNYDILGNHIRLIDTRNRESITDRVLGINIDKFFMPSVANVIGTDLSKYKLITKGKFACNPMHVGRDERLPVALYDEEKPAIVSPAYFMFEVVDNSILNEDYLMMWFRRPEFDRICWLHTDGSVRGGITWDDICRLELPIPPIENQLEIVNSYKAITERIALKQKINDNLANTEQAILVETVINNHTVPTALGDLVDFIDGDRGKNYPTFDEFTSTGYCLFLNASNVTSTGFNFDNCMFVSEEKDKLMNKGHLSPYDIVLGTGLRVGEVTGLRWCDIDMESGMIDVNHTLVYYDHRTEGSKSGCYFNVNTTKTPASMRQVPMLGFVREAFEQEKQKQEDLGLHCEVTIDGYTDFIFINRFGQAQHQATLNKAIRRIIRDCNDEQFLHSDEPDVLLPHFSCHSLRHTFTTRMCEAGVNIKVIQDALGHSDISTTLNIYADVTKEMKAAEFKGLDSYFKG